jgi:hypothetical protein
MTTKTEKDDNTRSKDEAKSTLHDVDESYFFDGPSTKKKLPDWFEHFNAKDLKILFKCFAVVWINSLLIFVNPTLRAIDQATFSGWYAVPRPVPSSYSHATA